MEIRGAPSLSDIFDQYITLKWRQGKVSGIWERKAKFVLHQTPKRSFGAPVSDVKFLDQKRSVGAPLIVTLRFWTKGSQLGPPVSSGGRLTSLEASLVRCFAFYKALGALFCKNNVQNIASLSKKCDVFTRCFRLYKVNPETKIDKQGKLSVENVRPRRPHIQVKEWLYLCAFSPVCVILCFCNLCACVKVQTTCKLVRLLASVCHHVKLQCAGESGGSVIVLFAAVWLFSHMLPNHVPS